MVRTDILLHPYVTEKTMNMMAGTPTQDYKDGNRIEFLVLKEATKREIKEPLKSTSRSRLTRSGPRSQSGRKRATIQLAEGYSAEDIGMRIGVF
jgi:large subunit ribosomal protein L23